MEKMREDFEEWYKRDYHPDKTGPYVKDAMLLAWQASRAALCVELPSQWFDDGLDCDLMEAHQVGKALDEAGVQYK